MFLSALCEEEFARTPKYFANIPYLSVPAHVYCYYEVSLEGHLFSTEKMFSPRCKKVIQAQKV